MPRTLVALALALTPTVAAAAPPPVTAVGYHPKGTVVAAGTHGAVRIFDAASGSPRGEVVALAGPVTAVAFDPTGKRFAVAAGEPGKGGEVTLVALDSNGAPAKEPAAAFTAHKDSVYALAFAPDGKTLATTGYDRLIHLWDVPAGGKVEGPPRLTLKDHSDAVYGLSFHPKGELLASAGADRAVKVWDTKTGTRLYTLGDPTDWVYCVAWSPDGKHLAAGGVDKSVRVWAADRDGGKLVGSAFAHEKPVWRLAFTADGKTLYTAGEDRVIKAWDAAKLTETKTFPAQPDTILDIALRPDGKQLAVARFDGAIVFLDPATGKQTGQGLPTKPVPPKPVKATPSAVVRGTPTPITVTGANLDQTTRVVSARQDVQVRVVERKPTKLVLEVTAPAGGAAGATQLTLEGEAGKAAPLAIAIDRFPATAEAGTSDSARVAQAVELPATIVGKIDRAGDADFFRFDAKAGDEVGAQVVAAELGSKLDPLVVLTDAGGTVLAEGTTSLGFRVPRAGTYAVGVRDREYRGGADFTYRLHVGPVPVVTGVFPLAVQRGRTTEVHVEGVNLGVAGKRQAKVTVPAAAAPGSKVVVPVTAEGEIPLGKPEVVVSDFAAVVTDPVAGADLRVPGSADGILTKPNEAQAVRFAGKKGQPVVIEALARRAGSPVDPVIEILDAEGKPVPRAVLRATAKTHTVFRDHDSASPGIRIEAWNELGIDDYLLVDGDLVRIVALPKGPDDDCQFYQVAGQRVGFLGTTPAHHAMGTPMYKVEAHPPGRAFPPNGLPLVTLSYRNDDGGAGFGKDSYLMFDPPADGEYQVRVTDARGSAGPTHAYRVTVRPPKPDFAVTFTPNAPAVWSGGGVPVTVTVTRTDGFDGPVEVKLEGLPEGFHAPETFVEAGHTTTAFALFADNGATVPPDTKLRLVAAATVGGQEVVRRAEGGMPKVVPTGDIVTTTRAAELVIRPGQETRFTVDIKRQGKFDKRVPIEVRGLPHGVRVMNIGLNGILITERETSREVVLYAEPWVRSMEHPIVVSAKREGPNTDHAAKSVLLKVQK